MRDFHVAPTYDYHGHHRIANIGYFFRNLPRYIHNKKSIRAMEFTSDCITRSGDLISFIAYLKQRNSIRRGLKCLFNKSYLFSEEARLLNRHEKCSRWLYDFCKENSLNLPMIQEKQYLY